MSATLVATMRSASPFSQHLGDMTGVEMMSLSGHEHDLTAGATPREILIDLAYFGQTINLGDRDLQAACVNQAGEFRKHLGIRRGAVALRLDAMFRGRREIDDRVDPVGRNSKFERQIHIAAAEPAERSL
jgi:hypothetical protein